MRAPRDGGRGRQTVPAFASIEKRMSRDTDRLHDALWHDGKGNRTKLIADLLRDARELDAFLRAGGTLRRNAEALAKQWGTPGAGESLFELLRHAHGFVAAAEALRRRDYRRAGREVAETVSSVTIGICAAAGCFELVQEWEGGKVDFETYMGRLADVLQSKGIERAGEWKRIVVAARHFGTAFDATASKTLQALGARSAILNGLWATITSLDIRSALGSAARFPAKDFAAIAERVAARV